MCVSQRTVFFLSICLLLGCKGPVNKDFPIVQNFKTGKSYVFKIEQGKYSYSDSSKLEVTTTATFEVIQDSLNFKKARLTYGKTEFSGLAHLLADDKLASSLGYKEGIVIDLWMTQLGETISVLNFENLKEQLKSNLGQSYKNSIPEASDEQIQQVFDLLAPTFSTSDALLGSYFPEVNIFFNLFGDTMNIDSVYHFTQFSRNPLGYSPVGMDAVLRIEKLDKNILTISSNQVMSKEQPSAFVQGLDSGATASKPLSTQAKKDATPSLQLSLNQLYTYDIERHVLEQALTRKTYNVDNRKMVETYSITMKAD